MPLRAVTLTGEQIRAARALARIEQAELAQRSRLSLETIKRLERIRGRVEANSRTLSAIDDAFASLGIQFDSCEEGGVGVCRLPQTGQPSRDRRPLPLPSYAGSFQAPLHRLTYHSIAETGPAKSIKPILDDLLATASRANEGLGVTGALFACHGRFLQVLEGTKEAVRQVFGAISSDPRHQSIVVLENRPIAARQFHEWRVCCGLFEADSGIFGHEPALKDGFRPDRLSPAAALGLLSVLNDLQGQEPRVGRTPAGPCPLASRCLDQVCAASAGYAGETAVPATF